MNRTLALVALLALASPVGCRRTPTPVPAPAVENALVVESELAPALPEAEDDEPASLILRRGEVLLPGRRFSRIKWSGDVLGAKVGRDAEMIEVRLAPRGMYVYVFASDVAEKSVPRTSHFCANAPKSAAFSAALPCSDVLRRYVFPPDEAIAFQACGAGACPIAHAKGESVTWTTVDGLSELYPATLGARRVLIGTAHWQRSLAETGRSVVVLSIEPGLPKLGELLLDEVDSRTDVVVARSGKVSAHGDTLELDGTRREVDKTSGRELRTTPVKETWALGVDGKLAKR